mmetsp:Transcript_20562/g.26596  ORF Transcript_20562/g.26596 Transcript_20562/m.26596 type:complete len:339 (+) Transcript_20562:104-1120(+)
MHLLKRFYFFQAISCTTFAFVAFDRDRKFTLGSPSLHAHTEGNEKTERRDVLKTIGATCAIVIGVSSTSVDKASGYQKAFPTELDQSGADIESIRREYISNKKRELDQKKSFKNFVNGFGEGESPVQQKSDTNKNTLTSIVWGGALWLLSGSRQNALVNPTANLLYDAEEEQWLKDRNEGLFAPLPTDFQIILGAIFLTFGFLVDRIVLFVTEGDANVCLQLAGVAAINGAFFELGRVASGEKDKSREESEREITLTEEFSQFAADRLEAGGNCHRSEVVRAFRRYNPKYRTDNSDFPLTDLEIEQLLRKWNRCMGNDEMSSAGFFSGIQLNKTSEVF